MQTYLRIAIWLLLPSTLLLVSCSTGTDVADKTTSGNETETSIATAAESSGQSRPQPKTKQLVKFSPLNKGEMTGKFTALRQSETGVYFANKWPDVFHPELPNSFITAGVAIGDINNDGLPDFFVCRRIGGGTLYLNEGNFKFTDVTEEYGLDLADHWGTGATFADINGDGKLDLTICGLDGPNRVYFNLGDRFEDRAKQLGLDYVGPSVVMSYSDYDRDGDLDVYLLTNSTKSDQRLNISVPLDENGRPKVPREFGEMFYYVAHPDGRYLKEWAGRYDHLFRNDGDKFTNVSEEVGMSSRPFFGLSATWWDYNDDGWPDLFVSNDFKGPDHLYRNNGFNKDGVVTFTDISDRAFAHTPWFSMGSDIADINNDGLMDLIATDMGGTTHYRDKLSMGPMSGPDSRAWFLNVPNPPQYMRNCVYLNTGTDRFMEAAFMTSLAATDWTWTARFSDFDQDGWQDAYFTNGMSRDWFNGDRREKAKKFHDMAGGGAKGERQGFEYWKLTPRYKTENLAFRNKGDLEFEDVSAKWGLDHKGVSTGGATADFDGDGDLDIIINGFDEPLRIYRNDVATGNVLKVYLNGRWSNRNGLGAKVTIESDARKQIRYLNSTQGIMSGSELVVHFGLGDSSNVDKLTVNWPSGVVQNIENIAANQSVEITEPEVEPTRYNPNRPATIFRIAQDLLPAIIRHEEVPFDDFQFQPLLPNKYTQLGPGIAWADIDGDGDDDCFFGAARGSMSRIYTNDDGKLLDSRQACFTDARNHEDMGALFFDADGDQDLDLYVVSGSGESKSKMNQFQDRLYLNDGQGKFSNATEKWLPSIEASGSCVVGSDFDRDGDVDLFIGGRIVPGAYPSPPQSFLLVNENDKFTAADIGEDVLKAGMVTSAIWSDVNSDGWNDLLVSYEWGPVRLFMNNEGRLSDATSETKLADHTGWFNSISSGDIDNDGDVDFVVGNFGLNTKYHASTKKPELLYFGEFDDTGKKFIVEAKFEDNTCYPRRGLGCSSHAIPQIKEKKSTFHEFAISSLEEIYSSAAIEKSMRFEANNLHSLVLINESTAKGPAFSVQPLPNIAQISPIFGMELIDINGDGFLDLFTAQNFYGPQRETGYMDGGVSMLFAGKGDGTFEPIWPNKSGILVGGDATGLCRVDLNGDQKPDIVVARNDSIPIYFANQTNVNFTCIRLEGDENNINATGSRIVVKSSDDCTAFDWCSGGNYLSQSSSTIFWPASKSIDSIDVVWPDGTVAQVNSPEVNNGCITIRYSADR